MYAVFLNKKGKSLIYKGFPFLFKIAEVAAK